MLLAEVSLFVVVSLGGAGAGTTDVCDASAHAIPDDGSVLEVALPAGGASGVVESLSVEIDVVHPWIGDLTIELTDGVSTATLVSRLSLGTYPFGCGGDDISATFTDSAVTVPESLCSPDASPNLVGDLVPATALGVFAGSAVDSAWTLRVTDEAAFDAGTLTGVCLRIVVAPPAGCVGDLDGDGDTDVFDFNVFAPAFGTMVGDAGYVAAADLDGSGTIDVFDFNLFAPDFGCTE